MICPLCREEKPLDFHHWDYRKNIGINLCRQCHREIHQNHRARTQGFIAKTQGAPGSTYDAWVEMAILILAIKELNYLPQDSPVHPYNSKEKWHEYLIDRYNLPFEEWELREILP